VSLDRALSGVPFGIDLIRCHQAAESLRGYEATHPVEPWSGESVLDQIVFKVLFISICHQMNWDVLQSTLAEWMLPGPARRLDEFASTTPSIISNLLQHYSRQDRVRARERAGMLRTTATALQSLVGPRGVLARLVDEPVLEGASGFYAMVRSLPAFTGDPMEKKARVLAHDLHREGILHFLDPENLKPAVEYHLLRLYLRTGRVYPTDDSVREELNGVSPTRTRLVLVLRETVDEAMRSTAFYAGLDVATLNYVEWQIARNICVPDLRPELAPMFCTAPYNVGLPSDVARVSPMGCTFSSHCRTLRDPSYGWFREPQFQKAIY
jgi:hypothetical protein